MTVSDTSTSRYANVLRNNQSSDVFGYILAENGGITGNCGMTFISKHYAITAAHCVADYPVPSWVYGARIKTTNLSVTAVNNRAAVSGTWPNWSSGPAMTSSHGYTGDGFACILTYKCEGSGFNCPSEAYGNDIALLLCDRPAPHGWVPVHSGDPISGEVTAFWYHEVLDLQRWPNDSSNNVPANNWNNYGDYSTSSYHYTNALGHQYLPIQSLTWSNGASYTIHQATSTLRMGTPRLPGRSRPSKSRTTDEAHRSGSPSRDRAARRARRMRQDRRRCG